MNSGLRNWHEKWLLNFIVIWKKKKKNWMKVAWEQIKDRILERDSVWEQIKDNFKENGNKES